ncbi:very long-chain acyl-CoA synthetase-like [Patiria miniata]|uniref:long-chain-fatty-acid--CoA ligase n=1 Tax=Patiria miniata TaxID=46514 RepID=A0A914B9R1_PATMI|nr:very long-chain acyl-CoA synthetase-like [Patiria miniata]
MCNSNNLHNIRVNVQSFTTILFFIIECSHDLKGLLGQSIIMSGSSFNRRVLGATVATLAGLPVAAAGILRLKYGPTVFQDLVQLRKSIQLGKELETLLKNKFKVIDFFEAHAKDTPEKEFVLYKDEVHTYGDLDRQANQLAHFVQRGAMAAPMDTVAIFMLNEPNYIVSWLAFNKLGLRLALLNIHLRGDVLLHCIKACNLKMIACGNDKRLIKALEDLMPDLQALGVKVWVLGKNFDHDLPFGMLHIDVKALNERSDPIPRSVRDQQPIDDDALYVFTSGTSGLPKPAKNPHSRQLGASYIQASFGLDSEDVVYTTLPMYHSAALAIGFFNVVRVGGTIALSDFSARRFWDDVRRYRATVIQYIGETCRYLMAQPPRIDDGKYSPKLRYAIGNGLRPDIWEAFQRRFNIGHIAEFYGATEATFSTFNMDGKVGSVGRYHGIFRALTDIVVIVQCHVQTAQPLRGPDGLCILTPPGETGLMLFRLTDKLIFHGYLAKKSDQEKKIVRNVKKNGDRFFNTGDLMIHDKDGYLYFMDRLGDTFRWKGENVATTEVTHVLNLYPGIQETNVYGVEVPGQDGKAGMASIVFKTSQRPFDPNAFYDHVVRSLPLYACPKFLRIMSEMQITGTFKHKKTDLAREGFDPNVISDPLFFMDTDKKTYAPLDNDVMRKIIIGKARL